MVTWKDIDIKKAREVVDDLDDFSRMTIGVAPTGAMKFFEDFFNKLELLKQEEIKVCRILQKP